VENQLPQAHHWEQGLEAIRDPASSFSKGEATRRRAVPGRMLWNEK
jgi:hypothetical protein